MGNKIEICGEYYNKDIIELDFDVLHKMTSMIEICGVYHDKNIGDLNLEDINLTEIPANIRYLTNLKSLRLNANRLTTIKENTFDGLTNLQELHLSNNRLREIKANTFDKLTNLQILHLRNIQITEVKENTFGRLTNLKELDLSNNQLTKIKECVFDGLTNLQKLYLLSNGLIEIKENTFDKLTNLQALNLNRNRLTEIKENTFNRLTNLQTLDLGFNSLTEIKENTFDRLTNLQILNLQYNYLTEIKENIFDSLTNLKELKLISTNLTEIKENVFDRLTNLQRLHLSDNELTEIKENTFDRLINLQELWLNNNNLKSLPLSILNCRRLEYLFYRDNEIDIIDIRIERFIDRMENYNNHRVFDDSQNVHSSSIQKSVKESINNLMKDSFTCKKKLIVKFLLTSKLECISSLLSYLDDKNYHSTLLLTFYEVFVKVFGRISNSPHKEELMRRLDEEMMESKDKCFTGRITRLLNVLNGFYEDIQITISNNERISAIILSTLNGQEMSDELREICRTKLKDIGIEDEEIEVWLR
uniref:Uncharacterized protein n=1 Tax=viral metagenome TaxID=1070528 RepID=A0A6C0ECI7_9ZZZZ